MKKNNVIFIYYCKAGEMVQKKSHDLLAYAAGHRYGAGNYEIQKKPGGKPFFAAHPDICFSISHSGDYWMCAFGDSEIGLDIQKVQKCSRERLAKRFFHPDEYAYLERLNYEPFFDVWAAKEAYLKYTGAGIAHGMDCESVVKDGKIAECVNEARLLKIEPGAGGLERFEDRYKIWLCVGSGRIRDSLSDDIHAMQCDACDRNDWIHYEIIDLKGLVF